MTLLADLPLPGTTVDPRYPDSNGRFMGDTDFHYIALIDGRETLDVHFAEVEDIYVASNLVMYYCEGFPLLRKDPDILVAKGVGKHRRRSFRVWEEGTFPCTLIEMASRKTWRNDIDEKRHLYAQLRIPEYFIFDPESIYLHPVLQGFRTIGKKSVPMKPGRDGSLTSKELRLKLYGGDTKIVFVNSKTGERLRSPRELAEKAMLRAEVLAEELAELKQRVSRLEAVSRANGRYGNQGI